eukprot:8768349-Pyramimonas_sp.AAC.1
MCTSCPIAPTTLWRCKSTSVKEHQLDRDRLEQQRAEWRNKTMTFLTAQLVDQLRKHTIKDNNQVVSKPSLVPIRMCIAVYSPATADRVGTTSVALFLNSAEISWLKIWRSKTNRPDATGKRRCHLESATY